MKEMGDNQFYELKEVTYMSEWNANMVGKKENHTFYFIK